MCRNMQTQISVLALKALHSMLQHAVVNAGVKLATQRLLQSDLTRLILSERTLRVRLLHVLRVEGFLPKTKDARVVRRRCESCC